MAITNGRLEAAITIPASCDINITDSLGAATATIAAGTYYMTSLLTALDTALEAAGAGDTWSVTGSFGEGGTGKVTIDNTSYGGTWAITWSGTSTGQIVRDLLGYSDDISTTTAATGAYQAKGVWMPDGPLQTKHGAGVGKIESDYRTTENAAGNVWSIYGQRKTVYACEWMVTQPKTRTSAESTTNESFETFWIDGILGEQSYMAVGGPLRIYWDADDDATYKVVVPVGLEMFDPEQVQEGFIGIYTISLDRLVEVPA